MTSLIRMRLLGYVRTGRFILPLLATLVVLGIAYGGGRSSAASAYGTSALMLFPVLAWQTKLLLDTEPDTQRRLALTALGSRRREVTAGLAAAALAAVPVILVALIVPWLLDSVTATDAGAGVLLGLWVHVLVTLPALGIGALSSRVIAGTPGRATAVLTSAVVLAYVIGLHGSPVPWLAPPLVSMARMLDGTASAAVIGALTLWAVLWAAVVVGGYGWLRRSRA
jgi:hypothetical protein